MAIENGIFNITGSNENSINVSVERSNSLQATISNNRNLDVSIVKDKTIEVMTAPRGVPGRGIKEIKKTFSEGTIDVYTIYYTDNTTSTFEVDNGRGISDYELLDNKPSINHIPLIGNKNSEDLDLSDAMNRISNATIESLFD